MATHSPSVVRALGADATVVWMRDGDVVGNEAIARQQMGWGLLDKKVLLLSEDRQVGLLKKIISQWPHIERRTAVWPLSGVTTLPAPDSLAGMKSLFGDSIQLVLHRDGDFLTDDEKSHWSRPYNAKGIHTWVTPGSDVEACFLTPDIVAATLGVDENTATALIQKALEDRAEDCAKNFAEKRSEHKRNEKLRDNGDAVPSNDEVQQQLLANSPVGARVGKAVAKRLRGLTQGDHENSANLGKICPDGIEVASSLKPVLEAALNIQPQPGIRRRRRRQRR